jgi:hypothetical protein
VNWPGIRILSSGVTGGWQIPWAMVPYASVLVTVLFVPSGLDCDWSERRTDGWQNESYRRAACNVTENTSRHLNTHHWLPGQPWSDVGFSRTVREAVAMATRHC